MRGGEEAKENRLSTQKKEYDTGTCGARDCLVPMSVVAVAPPRRASHAATSRRHPPQGRRRKDGTTDQTASLSLRATHSRARPPFPPGLPVARGQHDDNRDTMESRQAAHRAEEGVPVGIPATHPRSAASPDTVRHGLPEPTRRSKSLSDPKIFDRAQDTWWSFSWRTWPGSHRPSPRPLIGRPRTRARILPPPARRLAHTAATGAAGDPAPSASPEGGESPAPAPNQERRSTLPLLACGEGAGGPVGDLQPAAAASPSRTPRAA